MAPSVSVDDSNSSCMPEADAEHGPAALDALGDELVEPPLADPLHRLREGADARQDDAVGARRASGSG